MLLCVSPVSDFWDVSLSWLCLFSVLTEPTKSCLYILDPQNFFRSMGRSDEDLMLFLNRLLNLQACKPARDNPGTKAKAGCDMFDISSDCVYPSQAACRAASSQFDTSI